jgi:DedD protein
MDKMASPKAGEISAAELEIKRRGRLRLIGAITIGLLAIVFLPMIFDSEPARNKSKIKPGSQEISIQIPPKEGLPPLPAPEPIPNAAVASIVLPVAPPAALKAPAKVEITTDEKKDEKKPDPVTQVAKVAPALAPALVASPKPVAKAIELSQGFVVQIGAFKDAENAKQIIAQAKVAKLPVYTDSIAISGGTVTRVRVGPFATKQKADSALAQLKLTGSDGKIVPLP